LDFVIAITCDLQSLQPDSIRQKSEGSINVQWPISHLRVA
jgi:hypothetical protein